jgi:hypothetical protein
MFSTTPGAFKRAFFQRQDYFCQDCKQPIIEGQHMWTDMTDPTDGWHHHICPLKQDKFSI